MQEDLDNYLNLCENEVYQQTGIKFRSLDDLDRPIIDFLFTKEGWTFGRLVRASIVPREKDAPPVLTELYYDDAVHLSHLVQSIYDMTGNDRLSVTNILRAPPSVKKDAFIDEYRDRLPQSLRPAFALSQYRQFLRRILPLQPGKENAFEMLALQTSHSVLKKLADCEAFKIFVSDDRSIQAIQRQSGGRTPFMAGLRYMLSKALRDFENELKSFIAQKWQSPERKKHLAKPYFKKHPAEHSRTTALQFFFAPSGSGKTTSIFDKLTREYGHYILSSTLSGFEDIQPGSDDKNIMDPKNIRGVSMDTREITKMLSFIDELHLVGRSDRSDTLLTWWRRILESRSRVFRIFHQAKDSRSSPELWLSFQLDCGEWDPFLSIFRVLSLFPRLSGREDTIEAVSQMDPGIPLVQWVCVDEAQEDLKYQVKLRGGTLNMLTFAMCGIGNHAGPLFKQAIFAGTSLNIHEVLRARDWVAKVFHDINPIWDDDAYKVVANFPLVRDENDARNILRACGIKPVRVINGAAHHGKALWGRVRWTAMYADRIQRKLKRKGRKNALSVSRRIYEDLQMPKIANDTYETVVGHLIRRLDAIRKSGDGEDLLNKILEAAISADIRGLPHVFRDQRDLEVVEQGFATVTTRIDELESELTKYFTVVNRDINKLSLRLNGRGDVDVSVIDLLAKAKTKEFTIADCAMNAWTPQTAIKGFTIVDCITAKMSGSMKQQFIAAGRADRQSNIIEQLTKHGFCTAAKWTDNRLFTQLNAGQDLDKEAAEKLKHDLGHDIVTVNMTIEDLDNLIQGGFTILGPTLVAELRERVVIDAVLRYFDSKLNEKFLDSFRGVTNRTGLGHPAEHFLAVQLRQFFTVVPQNISHFPGDEYVEQLREEWKERRELVMASLAEAENNSDTNKKKLVGLNNSTLIMGDRTVKVFSSWNDWVDQFQGWLDAIEKGNKPCASFLLPHNDFGPDLVFALREKAAGVILCSVQLKMGGGGPDAVHKSSASWACVGVKEETRKRQHSKISELEQDLVKLEASEQDLQDLEQKVRDVEVDDHDFHMQLLERMIEWRREAQSKVKACDAKIQQLRKSTTTDDTDKLVKRYKSPFWKHARKLSLLVAADSDVRKDLEQLRPLTHCDEEYEYYKYIAGKSASHLFGKPFMDILQGFEN